MKLYFSYFAFVVLMQLQQNLKTDACPYLRASEGDLSLENAENVPLHGRRLQPKPAPGGPGPGPPPAQPIPPPPKPAATAIPQSSPSFSPSKAPSSIPLASPSNAPVVTPTSTSNSGLLGVCLKTSLPKTSANTCAAYKSIKTAFDTATRNPNTLADIYGISVRLAFHDAAEIDLTASDSLGPDGCLSQTSSNAGLIEATSLVTTLMEPMWQQYCDKISRADFWVLFAKLSVEKADPTRSISVPFHYGRKDNSQCSGGAGRLPSAGQGLTELNRVFVTQMGLTLRDSVTLLGAHTLGHTHIANSGFGVPIPAAGRADLVNAWDGTPAQFDNQYYINMATRRWTNNAASVSGQNQWSGPGLSIMLNADMALAFDISTTNGQGVVGQTCAPAGNGQAFGCTRPTDTDTPATASQVQGYVNSNALFLSDFSAAFTKMVTVGYATSVSGTGKLGVLTSIDLTTC